MDPDQQRTASRWRSTIDSRALFRHAALRERRLLRLSKDEGAAASWRDGSSGGLPSLMRSEHVTPRRLLNRRRRGFRSVLSRHRSVRRFGDAGAAERAAPGRILLNRADRDRGQRPADARLRSPRPPSEAFRRAEYVASGGCYLRAFPGLAGLAAWRWLSKGDRFISCIDHAAGFTAPHPLVSRGRDYPAGLADVRCHAYVPVRRQA